MAVTAAISLSALPNGVDSTQQQLSAVLKLTFSSTYTTDGDTLDLSGIDALKSNQIPNFTSFADYTAPPTGYVFQYTKGTTLANGKVVVLQCAGSGNPLAQISSGAYPAALTDAGAKVNILVWLPSEI